MGVGGSHPIKITFTWFQSKHKHAAAHGDECSYLVSEAPHGRAANENTLGSQGQ